jgi:hypothetical protein
VLRLSVGYTWNRDNTVAVRTEYDGTVSPERTITVEYTYDARRRLIEEEATVDSDPAEPVYHYTYTYDPLGNRRTKYDAVGYRETRYAYDTDWDGTTWRSHFVPWTAGGYAQDPWHGRAGGDALPGCGGPDAGRPHPPPVVTGVPRELPQLWSGRKFFSPKRQVSLDSSRACSIYVGEVAGAVVSSE